jgi:choline kinase
MLELTASYRKKLAPANKTPKQAVILAAGLGSRLAKTSEDVKPLKLVGGMSLIQRNIEHFASFGIEEVVIVTGYHADILEAQLLKDCANIPVKLTFVFNPDFKKSNGLSVLCAQKAITGNFILTMADHIFEPEMIEKATQIIPPKQGAILCVDYKLDEVFDMDDATKVRVVDNKVAAIGKQITDFNAVDTGLFICTPTLFSALQKAADNSPKNDCSLSEGIATLMKTGRMAVYDIGLHRWQDVDDDMMLHQAESMVAELDAVKTAVPA